MERLKCAWCEEQIVAPFQKLIVIDCRDGFVTMHEPCADEWATHLELEHGLTLAIDDALAKRFGV